MRPLCIKSTALTPFLIPYPYGRRRQSCMTINGVKPSSSPPGEVAKQLTPLLHPRCPKQKIPMQWTLTDPDSENLRTKNAKSCGRKRDASHAENQGTLPRTVQRKGKGRRECGR